MKKYRVEIAESGKRDVIDKKRYIIEHFKYRAYAQHFSQKIKQAAKQLDTFPTGYEPTGFQYRGYIIYIKPQSGHLLFYTVDEQSMTVTVLRVLQDGMDWQNILEQWLHENE